MATHSSVLAWRIPGTGEPGGLPLMGSHRVRHDWSDLAAAAAAVNNKPLWTLRPMEKEERAVIRVLKKDMFACFPMYFIYLSIDLTNFMAHGFIFVLWWLQLLICFFSFAFPCMPFVCMTFSLKPISSFYFCFIFFTLFTLFSMTPTEVFIVSIPLWDPCNTACISWKICMLLVFFFPEFCYFHFYILCYLIIFFSWVSVFFHFMLLDRSVCLIFLLCC